MKETVIEIVRNPHFRSPKLWSSSTALINNFSNSSTEKRHTVDAKITSMSSMFLAMDTKNDEHSAL